MSAVRECPACGLDTPAEASECPFCGYEFPFLRPGLRASAWVMIALTAGVLLPLLAWALGAFH